MWGNIANVLHQKRYLEYYWPIESASKKTSTDANRIGEDEQIGSLENTENTTNRKTSLSDGALSFATLGTFALATLLI